MIHYITEFCTFAVRSDTPDSGPLSVVEVVPGTSETKWPVKMATAHGELDLAIMYANSMEFWDTLKMNSMNSQAEPP